MTNVDMLPLTSDDAANVNPFLMFHEHFEQRRDYLGRPLSGPTSRDVASIMDAASIADTRAWLDARKDDKGEPTGIYVPPIEHSRPPTPDEQAWLDLHPEYAIKEGEGRDYTFVPFPSKVSQEPANMTTKTTDVPVSEEHKPRHMATDKAYPDNHRHDKLRTDRSTYFVRTSDDVGIGVWSVAFNGAKQLTRFADDDPQWIAATQRLAPIARGAKYPFVSDVTWHSDGYAVADLIVEVMDMAKPTDAEVRQQAKAAREELEQDYPEMTTNELDKAFPRDADNTPADPEKPTYLGHTAVPDEAIHAIPNHIRRELALAPEKVGLHVRNALGTATPDYIGKHGVREAWDKALDYVAKVKADNAAKNGQQAASSEPSAMGIPEKPSSPVPDEKPRSEPANVSPDVKPAETPKADAGPILGMSEAGFSMNFFWYNADGEERQFTMRAPTWRQGLADVGEFEAGLRALGFMPKVEYLRKAGQQVAPAAGANAIASPSTPVGSDKGKSPCSLIKVGTSFEGGKTQLQFECDGFEIPFRFTKGKGDMVRLLSKVKQVSGAPITEADIEVGKKLIGSWLVSWEKVEREGKTRYNVVAVEPAA